MKKEVLKSYAKLIVKVGVNVQKGQDVIIQASVNDNFFVKYIVEECYKAGANLVSVDWFSDDISKLTYKKASTKALCEYPKWKEEKWAHEVETLPARIYLDSKDPDLYKGVNQDKITKINSKVLPIVRKYRNQMDNKYQWTIVGVPSEAWAKKVFPELSKKAAYNKLWDLILEVTRVNGDPILNWKNHNAYLSEKTSKLNALNVRKLIYKSSNGTDFSVCIKKELQFCSGDENTLSGITFNPNMPTEECFTSPDKDSANGVVYATKPLSVMGSVVDNFGFRFENGKIVEVLAKNSRDKEVLENLISIDDGAKRLGEVALVPYDSPINKTGILFYSTLYDENACCHLALGVGFTDCIKNFETKTEEEIENIDINKSAIHVDFMIGSSDLSIVGIDDDGNHIQIFKDGTWAI